MNVSKLEAKQMIFDCYVRHRRLIDHNEALKRPEFVKIHRDQADMLEKIYPDFPEAYLKYRGRR